MLVPQAPEPAILCAGRGYWVAAEVFRSVLPRPPNLRAYAAGSPRLQLCAKSLAMARRNGRLGHDANETFSPNAAGVSHACAQSLKKLARTSQSDK